MIPLVHLVPAGQLVHCVVDSANVPSAQVVHDAAPGPEVFPAGQGEQVSCPAAEKVPASHGIGDVFVVGHL